MELLLLLRERELERVWLGAQPILLLIAGSGFCTKSPHTGSHGSTQFACESAKNDEGECPVKIVLLGLQGILLPWKE